MNQLKQSWSCEWNHEPQNPQWRLLEAFPSGRGQGVQNGTKQNLPLAPFLKQSSAMSSCQFAAAIAIAQCLSCRRFRYEALRASACQSFMQVFPVLKDPSASSNPGPLAIPDSQHGSSSTIPSQDSLVLLTKCLADVSQRPTTRWGGPSICVSRWRQTYCHVQSRTCMPLASATRHHNGIAATMQRRF